MNLDLHTQDEIDTFEGFKYSFGFGDIHIPESADSIGNNSEEFENNYDTYKNFEKWRKIIKESKKVDDDWMDLLRKYNNGKHWTNLQRLTIIELELNDCFLPE